MSPGGRAVLVHVEANPEVPGEKGPVSGLPIVTVAACASDAVSRASRAAIASGR
ncbi:MAG TPA: hypothetical protein VHR38_04460 [Solirubrobacterales bacterium]|nr:hypothetical protein [Solirubrobacterales bacterium]